MGRSAELASALETLRLRGVLALVGASGSGKTSFARAGVAPAVLDGALGEWPPKWQLITFTPGPDAGASLFHALGIPPSADIALGTVLKRRVESEGVGIVILVDALEELVTLSHPSTRGPLLGLLDDLNTNPRPGLRAIVTLRRDLLDPLLALGSLANALTRGAQIVTPLTPTSLARSLEERIGAYGFALEDKSMREALAAELAATAESMPLVEFALARLWQERDEQRRVLSRASLARIGGIAGALEQHAESVVSSLITRHGANIVETTRAVLLALTTPQGTRTRSTQADLAKATSDARREDVLGVLEQARLVVREDGRFTLAHEALLIQWPRLRQWTQDARRDRELVAEVERSAARWKEAPSRDRLLRGRGLADARSLGLDLYSDEARAFLKTSRSAELRDRIGILALVASVLAAMVIFTVLYLQEQRLANEEKRAAKDFVLQIASARNAPEHVRAKELADLIAAKHACEKALSRCPAPSDSDAGPLP
jgi:hypothetical protein